MKNELFLRQAMSAALFALLLMAVGRTNALAQQGVLNGVFTINGVGDKVCFSRGNLRYDGSTNRWRFAEEQWDVVGSSQNSNNQNILRDLFGWGTSGWNNGNQFFLPWNTDDSNGSHYGPCGNYNLTSAYANSDWGVYNAIINGGNIVELWYTLSIQEWQYILENRSASYLNGISDARFTKAIVNGVKGIILFPDVYIHPIGITEPVNINSNGSNYTSNIYQGGDWDNMELAGCVFLPTAGKRNGTNVLYVGESGLYWSNSSANASCAKYFNFNKSSLGFNYCNRGYGYSVRLVCNVYTVGVSPNPNVGGSVSGGGTYITGQSCTLQATPNMGYTFVNWTENGISVSTNAIYTFNVTDNRTLVANFQQQLQNYIINVSANPDSGGTVSGGGSYVQGANCTLTATANDGYTFVNWTRNGTAVSSNPTYSFTVTESGSYEANFSLNSYYVVATANPSTGGSVTGSGTYDHGSTATLVVTANTGYTFTNWTENGTVVSTNASYSFTVQGNRTLVANFVPSGPITNHWTPESAAYSDNMAFNGVVQIDGVEQYSNMLEVGAFCGGECRGSAIATLFSLTQRYIITMTVYGEAGHQLTFKLFDHAIGEELNLTSPEAVVFDVNGYGTPVSPYVLNFTSSLQTQATPLVSGWNWYSTYIEQNGMDGLSMFENSLGTNGLRIQGRNAYVEQFEYQGAYYWYGTLNNIANEQMYKVRTNSACNAVMEGYLASATDHPITVNNGWNWIGYPLNLNVSVENAMAGFEPEADDMIKGRNGYATYIVYGNTTMWYGTLNTLEPGRGYMYKSNSDTSKTLTFQTGKGEDAVTNITSENNYFTPNDGEFANNMVVTAVVDIDGEELRSDDYELSAFVGDECRGSAKLMYVEPYDRYMAFLMVYGEGEEEIHFVLTDGMEMIWSDDQMVFASDAIVGTLAQPANIHFGVLGVNDSEQLNVVVYPNPSDGTFIIKGEGIRKIEVINAYGQVIVSKEKEGNILQIDLGNKTSGTFVLRVITNNGTVMKKLFKK